MMSNMWLFWAVLSTVLTASTVVFAKMGVGGVNTSLMGVMGTVLMVVSVALIAIAVLQWRTLSAIPLRSWVCFGLMALADVGAWICYFRALKFGDAARVASVDKFSVVLVAIISVTVLGEKLSPPNWLGIVLIAGGVALATLK
ncbi:EamA family transporter [Asticcacaulis solisilvae]|uniref:EamA family transporter n=1 Tax=Asticcacaulis solisilvae TaxID=1217274 RepID=UPI003FD7E7C2